MFQLHLNGEKHKKEINKKHALHSMLRKGNIVSQITTGIENSQIEKVQHNRRVISKLIKTVYFMSKKQWPVKNNFYDLIEHIKNLGDVDLIEHFQTMDKNATYVSKFTVDEFLKICSDFVEEKFLLTYSLQVNSRYSRTKALMKLVELNFQFSFSMLMLLRMSPRKNLSVFES